MTEMAPAFLFSPFLQTQLTTFLLFLYSQLLGLLHLDSAWDVMQHTSFSVWLNSLNKILIGSVHALTDNLTPFYEAECCERRQVWVCILQLPCASIYWQVHLVYCDEHQDINLFMGGDSILFGCMTQKRGGWLMALIFISSGTSTMAELIYLPINSTQAFTSLCFPANIRSCLPVLFISHSNKHYVPICNSLTTSDVEYIFFYRL